MQEGVSQNSFVFQVTNIAATFPVLNGELLLLKAILENQNLTGCLGVAVVNVSVVIKGRDIIIYKLYWIYNLCMVGWSQVPEVYCRDYFDISAF